MNQVNLILGTMTFGESVFQPDVRAFVNAFLDAGYTELDTAYVYNEGTCERLLGEVLPELDRPFRIATKVNPRITGRLDDGMLEFSVTDTGTGMTEEQLNELNERMKKGQTAVSEGTGGFGLVNVNLRIRLYYNQTEGLNIISNKGGTTVSFRVPCRTREEISENESIPG